MKNLSFATRPKQIVIVLLFQWKAISRNLHQIHFPTGKIVTQEEHYWGRTKEQIYWTNCRVNWDGYQKEVILATPNKSLTTIVTLFSAKSVLLHFFVPQTFIQLLIATLSNKCILYSYNERKNALARLVKHSSEVAEKHSHHEHLTAHHQCQQPKRTFLYRFSLICR